MADIYEIKLPSGKVVAFESDAPPSPEEEAQIIAAEMQGAEKEKPKRPFIRRDSLGILRIGENLIPDSMAQQPDETDEQYKRRVNERTKAVTTSAAQAFIPGGAGMAAFGGLARGLKIADAATKLSKVGKTGAALAGSFGAAAGTQLVQDAALKAAMPDVMESAGSAQAEHPAAAMVGGLVGGNAPYQRIGATGPILREIAERGLGAGIAGGVEAGRQVATTGEVDLSLMGLAALGGAAFNAPTKLGEAAMTTGGKAANAITSKLGNASTKSSVVQANAAANDIAMAPSEPPGQTTPPPVDKFGVLAQENAVAGMPKVAGAPEATVGSGLGDIAIDVNAATPERIDATVGARRPSAKDAEEAAAVLSGLMPTRQATGPARTFSESGIGEPIVTSAPAARDTELARLLAAGQQPEVITSRAQMGDVQSAPASRLSELSQAGEAVPATGRPEVQPNLLKTQKGALPEVAGPELKTPMEFEAPARRPEVQARELADFNTKVLSVQRNLKNAGVDADRATAVRLARLANNPEEFNAARQKLIDSVKTPAPEIPESGPMKSLAELPPKMGQDDAVMPEAEGVAPKAKEAAPAPTKPAAPKSDYERYQEIQKEWAGLIKQGKGDGPEIQKLWAENEEIKNRHEGMPPEPPKAPEPAKEAPAPKKKRSEMTDDELLADFKKTYAQDEANAKAAVEKYSGEPWYDEYLALKKETNEAFKTAKFLKEHPLDYPPAYRAAATRKASKLLSKEMEFTRKHGITTKEHYDIDFAMREGLELKPAKKAPEAPAPAPKKLAQGVDEAVVSSMVDDMVEAGEPLPYDGFSRQATPDEWKQAVRLAKDSYIDNIRDTVKEKTWTEAEGAQQIKNAEARYEKMVEDFERADVAKRQAQQEASKPAAKAPKRVSVDDLDAIDEIVGGQEAPAESYAVKTNNGTKNIIKKASDGNWYDEETGKMLSGGSRQVAIKAIKDNNHTFKKSPEAMGIVPPEDMAVRATRRGVEAANEKLTEMMAKADVEATNPQAQASMFDELFGPMKKSPVQQAKENEVNFPKPGEGRAQPKTELERLKEIQVEEGMLPTVDSITGRSLKSYRLKGEEPPAWMVENEKKNAEIIFNKLKKSADEVGSEVAITPEAAGEIAQVPEQYRPFLTDLADRFKFMEKPILNNVSRGVGRFATFIKRQMGRQMDNIGDVYSPLEGAILKRDHVEGLMLNNYSKRANLFELARKHMSNEDFFKMEKTLRNREPEATFALFKGNPKEQELIAAYNSTREVLDEVREKLIAAGRDIGDLADYFPSRVADYVELAKFHGRDAQSKYEKALREFERTNKRKATTVDKDNLLNQILAGNRTGKGGPAWTKARTIDKVSEAELAFYEPPDVALAMYLREASKDIANSVFFGKIDVENPSSQPWADQSSFGRTVNEGLASGAIRDRGLAIIEDNMRDLFRTRSGIREDLSGIAAKLRRAQTALYLSDVSSAAVQYLDILSIAREYGVYGAAKAYGKNMPKVADIGVAEGHNIDLTELSRKKRGTGHVITAPYRWALKNLLGAADEMQKSALMKGATAAISRAMKDPDSRLFKQTEERYSKMFPKEWEQMKKSLASEDFAKGKLDDSTRLFLFAEMARLQPISDAARAQGFNAATPWGKLLYALRSYWLTQLGIVRRQGYNELKKGTIEGFRKGSLAIMSYSLVVAMGQQAFQYAKDKVFGRDEANWDDYAIGGVLQLFGIPRYALFRAGQTGWGSAGLEAALPGTSAVNDFGKDVATLAKFATGHRQADSSKSVETPLDLLQQLESVKYGPILGREVYALAGAGKLKAEREKERLNRGGEPRPSAREQILEFFVPPDAKRR